MKTVKEFRTDYLGWRSQYASGASPLVERRSLSPGPRGSFNSNDRVRRIARGDCKRTNIPSLFNRVNNPSLRMSPSYASSVLLNPSLSLALQEPRYTGPLFERVRERTAPDAPEMRFLVLDLLQTE